MTARPPAPFARAVRVLLLAISVLAVASSLPPALRAVFGLAVSAGALLYLAAGFLPAPRRPVLVVGVRMGEVARCWAWPAL